MKHRAIVYMCLMHLAACGPRTDGRTAYLILMNDPTLLEIDLKRKVSRSEQQAATGEAERLLLVAFPALGLYLPSLMGV